jgi:rSAM/selenodomain-associated transferase 1
VDTFITYTPHDAGGYFEAFGLKLFPQSEGDIGIRMHRAIERVLNGGYEKAVLVGVDIPSLCPATVLKAFDLLSDHSVVFGPAEDGGYYLIGLKTPTLSIFQDIDWSTEQTLNQSKNKARYLDLSIGYTEMLSDVDRIEDIKQLKNLIQQ